MSQISALMTTGAIALSSGTVSGQAASGRVGSAAFGPENPFYAPSTLPFHAPPFDKIKDTDYLPAIEAGIAQKIEETGAIADNTAEPTFENTIVAMEKTGQLYDRVMAAFHGVTGANTNPLLQSVRAIVAPKRAAMDDAIYLNGKLFERVSKIYEVRNSLHLDPESLRLVEQDYKQFVRAGARLSDADKATLKKMNEEIANLSTAFSNKLLAATKDSAYVTADKSALAGLSDAQMAAAAQAAKDRGVEGWVLALQNTTQQPSLQSLSNRKTRQALFEDSWTRAERGGTNDTRDTIVRLAQLRAQKAKLLGFPNYAAWNLEDQMARTPEAALKFMDALVPAARAKAEGEAKDIQALIGGQQGGFALEPWDWNFYSEQVRKAKYDLDEAETRPY
ncbi:MAG: M3 family metallopeptidase, partial [Terracidiphilus sp.]